MLKSAIKPALITLLVAVVFPALALAANLENPPPPPQLFYNAGDVFNFISNIITFFFWIIMAFSVILVLWAAFKYLTAQGNPENVQAAQKILLYAVIAIVIALLARSVPTIVSDLVQNAATTNSGYGP